MCYQHFPPRDGELIAEDSDGAQVFGQTHWTEREYDRSAESHIAEWFNERYSVRFRNYAFADPITALP